MKRYIGKVIILGKSGSGKSFLGLSLIKKYSKGTVIVGSCANKQEYIEKGFGFLKDYTDHNCINPLIIETGKKYFFSDPTSQRYGTGEMNAIISGCGYGDFSQDKKATIFYDDGTWYRNTAIDLWKMSHCKCNILISANSLGDILQISDNDITKDMRKDMEKLGWKIVEL